MIYYMLEYTTENAISHYISHTNVYNYHKNNYQSKSVSWIEEKKSETLFFNNFTAIAIVCAYFFPLKNQEYKQ